MMCSGDTTLRATAVQAPCYDQESMVILMCIQICELQFPCNRGEGVCCDMFL